MGASARRVRVQRGRRRLPRRLRSPTRRWVRRLVGLLGTLVLAGAAVGVGRLVLPDAGLPGVISALEAKPHGAGGGEVLRLPDGPRRGHVTTLRRAVRVLRAHGYAPVRRADYRPHAVLRV